MNVIEHLKRMPDLERMLNRLVAIQEVGYWVLGTNVGTSPAQARAVRTPPVLTYRTYSVGQEGCQEHRCEHKGVDLH